MNFIELTLTPSYATTFRIGDHVAIKYLNGTINFQGNIIAFDLKPFGSNILIEIIGSPPTYYWSISDEEVERLEPFLKDCDWMKLKWAKESDLTLMGRNLTFTDIIEQLTEETKYPRV